MSLNTLIASPAESQKTQITCPQRISRVQRVLLITAAACAIISVIPPLRLGGCLALRAVSLLSALIVPSKAEQGGHLLKALQVSALVVGIIGLATSMPTLIIASLAADMAFQTFGAMKALYNGELKLAALHVVILVIDALALAGMVAGSWKLMVAAAATSAAALLVFAIGAAASKNYDTALALLALSGASSAAAFFSSEIIVPKQTIITEAHPPQLQLPLPWPLPKIEIPDMTMQVPVDVPPIVLNSPMNSMFVTVGGAITPAIVAQRDKFLTTL